MYGILNPVWPLAREPKNWTAGGSFGAKRDSGKRLHQGIDLYAPEGTPVIAAEDGIVVASQGWSGPGTKAVLVYSPASDITILYGAVAPGSFSTKGKAVLRGDKIATIGVYPHGSTMLHLEVWPGQLAPPRPRWNPGDLPPSLDPAPYLERAKATWTLVPGLVDGEPVSSPAPDQDPGLPPPAGGSGGAFVVAALAAAALLFLR